MILNKRIYCFMLDSRKVRLIEGNAKCRQLKKLTCKRTLRQVFICLWPRTQYTPPSYTLYTCIQYNYSHGEGEEGGRVEPERRKYRLQSWVENNKMTESTPEMNSDKHLPQSPFTWSGRPWKKIFYSTAYACGL